LCAASFFVRGLIFAVRRKKRPPKGGDLQEGIDELSQNSERMQAMGRQLAKNIYFSGRYS
jgi:hypothetical protein